MGHYILPKVGDIIKFSGKWNLTTDDPDKSPAGVIIRIRTYSTIDSYELYNDLFGTLAYPLSIDANVLIDSKVFVVEWATSNEHLKYSYRCINEEWFYNGVFFIISKA